jgi:hypothetical protein
MGNAAATCRSCEAGWEHCHGTVVRHSLRHWECTDVDCPSPELVPHSVIIDCEAVGCACDQPIGSVDDSSLSAAVVSSA